MCPRCAVSVLSRRSNSWRPGSQRRHRRASSSWSPCPAAAFCCAGRSRSSPCTATGPVCSSKREAPAASGSPGSRWGRRSSLAGPLGSAFPTEGVGSALLVGGGIGCAPLQYLADELSAAGAGVIAAFGFRDFRAARAVGAFGYRAPLGRQRRRRRRTARDRHRHPRTSSTCGPRRSSTRAALRR